MCSTSWAWCRLARRSHSVVEIEVPTAPQVIRTKFDRPDALGIFSGGISLSVIVIKGMKKPAMAMPCTMVGIMMVVKSTWVLKRALTGTSLSTASVQGGSFTPNGPDQWGYSETSPVTGDYLTSNLMMPLFGLVLTLLLGWRLGDTILPAGLSPALRLCLLWCWRLVAPLLIAETAVSMLP